MNRNEWQAFSRNLRKAAHGRESHSKMIRHGGTYWTIRFSPRGQIDHGLTCKPAAIRDRSAASLAAVELDWTRAYRREMTRHKAQGAYFANAARLSFKAAKSCIADCRAWLASRSVFRTF